jgi:hypothetical protein
MKFDDGDYAKQHATLEPHHVEFLHKRAVLPEVSCERGYRTITVKARLADKGFSPLQRLVPGLLIPLFNACGECVGYQYRPDEPRVRDGRTVKYESPSKSRPVIDVPKRLSLPRKVDQQTPFEPSELPPLILDVTVPLVVTEGIPKADAAVGIGFCCIALLGVSAWHRLPDWNDFPVRGRTIYLCFDSDALQKWQVWRQLDDLKEWLESHGADVRIISLPCGPAGEKRGLDDWIAAQDHASGEEIRAMLLAFTSCELPPPPARMDADEVNDLPRIMVSHRYLRDITAESLDALRAANNREAQYWVRSRALVRVRVDDDGRPDAELLGVDALLGALARCANYVKETKTGVSPTDPPVRVVKDILSLPRYEDFPELKNIAFAPFVTSEGEMVLTNGYHAPSCTLLYLSPELGIPPIPEKPSDDDVEAALALLCDELLGDFPLVGPPDLAHALSALLYPPLRELIDTAPPGLALDASLPASGKGLLANVISVISTGGEAEILTVEEDPVEMRKQITSLHLSGSPFAVLDNLAKVLANTVLAAAMTAPVWKDRILGTNKIVRLKNRIQWMITGNNLRMTGEMLRRFTRSRLEPPEEYPELRRDFQHDPLIPWVFENRGKLVGALITLIRNWLSKGARPFTRSRLGSFEKWAQTVGGVLDAAGIVGFLEARDQMAHDVSPDSEAWHGSIKAWHGAHGELPVLVKDLVPHAEEHLTRQLGDAETERAKATRLGGLLRQKRGAVVGDWKIEPGEVKGDQYQKRPGWKLSKPIKHERDHHRVRSGQTRHKGTWGTWEQRKDYVNPRKQREDEPLTFDEETLSPHVRPSVTNHSNSQENQHKNDGPTDPTDLSTHPEDTKPDSNGPTEDEGPIA